MLSLDIPREPLLKFLAFSEYEPFPYPPNFPRNGSLGIRTGYGHEIRIILKLRTRTITRSTLGTSINGVSLIADRPFT